MQLKLSRKSAPEDSDAPVEEAAPVVESVEQLADKLTPPPRNDELTGIEISVNGIAAVQVSGGRIKTGAYMGIEPGLVTDGEIVRPEELGRALAELTAASGLSDKVRIGVASSRVVIRSFEMPAIADKKEFEAAVRFQAADHLPMAVDEAIIDCQIVGTSQPEEAGAQPTFKILLVGASRGLIDSVMTTAEHAGLKLQSVDLSAFGLIRVLYPGAAHQNETICYLHVGDMVNVTIAQGTVCKFTRVTPSGLDATIHRLTDSAQLTREHAQMWIEHVGTSRPLESIQGDPAIVRHTREELETMVNQLGNDVNAAVDFHNAQDPQSRVSRIMLAGPVSKLDGVAEALAARTNLAVTTPAPLGALDASQVESEHVDPTRLTIAAGLSLDEVAAR
jgi:type IV pilus assembly protein PilM